MRNNQKIVTSLPLTQLWTAEADLDAVRGPYLNRQQLRAMLKNGPVVFVVANAGERLKWIPANECYEFWKSGVENHLADHLNPINPESFPDHFAWLASEWLGDMPAPVILLEQVH